MSVECLLPLTDHARQLGLGGYLRLSRGEELHGGRDRPSALADTFEAFTVNLRGLSPGGGVTFYLQATQPLSIQEIHDDSVKLVEYLEKARSDTVYGACGAMQKFRRGLSLNRSRAASPFAR